MWNSCKDDKCHGHCNILVKDTTRTENNGGEKVEKLTEDTSITSKYLASDTAGEKISMILISGAKYKQPQPSQKLHPWHWRPEWHLKPRDSNQAFLEELLSLEKGINDKMEGLT